MMKERAELLPDFVNNGAYCFEPVTSYDEKTAKRKFREIVKALLTYAI